MSSNGAGRASVPGVGCRVSVFAAEVGAAAVLFMSQYARVHSTPKLRYDDALFQNV